MIHSLYCLILRLHPASFRREFAREMLWIFDRPDSRARRARLLADGLVSLIRQWTVRGEFRRPPAVIQAAAALPDVPMFQTVAPLHLRPSALANGGLIAIVSFGLVGVAIQSGKERVKGGAILLPKGERAAAPVFSRDGDRAELPSEPLRPSDTPPTRPAELQTGLQTEPQPAAPIEHASYFSILPVLRVLDTNHDQALSMAEIDRAPARLRMLDRDRDGRLGARECGFRLGFGSSQSPVRYMSAHPVHRLLDADGDRTISAQEIIVAPARLRALDTNRDGLVDVRELLRP